MVRRKQPPEANPGFNQVHSRKTHAKIDKNNFQRNPQSLEGSDRSRYTRSRPKLRFCTQDRTWIGEPFLKQDAELYRKLGNCAEN